MNENRFKKDTCYVLEELGFHTTFHEDKHLVGIPDVSWGRDGVNGWIEFKLGARASIRPAQLLWLKKRQLTGEHCSVLWWLPVGVYYVGGPGLLRLESRTRRAVIAEADARWDIKDVDYEDLALRLLED
jgi:hypothetical protein